MSAASPATSLPTFADIAQRQAELIALASRLVAEADAEENLLDPNNKNLFDLEHQQPQPPEPQALEPEAPPTLQPAALHGLAGNVVRAFAPHSEADPAALLLQFLAACGNLFGSTPHALVGSTRHALNLFVILVGESSKARKGTSWRQISELFAQVDPDWAQHRVTTVRPTPANIFASLRNRQPATDRRLFLLAEEFASVLYLLGLPSGQLASLLRCAWDGEDLSAYDGHQTARSLAPHLSLVGHITQSELLQRLGRNQTHNGFANRCLWASVRRSQSLPEGGSLPAGQSAALASELVRIVHWVNTQPLLIFRRSEEARTLWNDSYPALSERTESRPDIYGAATSRAEAQVLRLSALYAALDESPLVETCHLQAALAVWDYCQASARQLFDGPELDATARRINDALNSHPQGLSKTQIRALFHGHITLERVDRALQHLVSLGLICSQTNTGKGRPATQWAITQSVHAET